MLIVHVVFVLTSVVSFVTRIILSELNSPLLSKKPFKIVPHVIDTALLASGITLVIQGNWIGSGHYHWIISKFMVLLVYVCLGIVAMRSRGIKRWISFAGALACYGYILSVAITKQAFF